MKKVNTWPALLLVKSSSALAAVGRNPADDNASEKSTVTLPGTVEKIIKSPFPNGPEKAQIAIERADDLYREIRIENSLEKPNGREVRLKPGAQVELTVEADPEDVVKANSAD